MSSELGTCGYFNIFIFFYINNCCIFYSVNFGEGSFNRPGTEVDYFYSENGLEVTFNPLVPGVQK